MRMCTTTTRRIHNTTVIICNTYNIRKNREREIQWERKKVKRETITFGSEIYEMGRGQNH